MDGLRLGKLKFQITNQQITIQTKFTGLKIEDIPKKNNYSIILCVYKLKYLRIKLILNSTFVLKYFPV
jgi:hypothetical protein